jgi:hypothetical protein
MQVKELPARMRKTAQLNHALGEQGFITGAMCCTT